MSLKDFDIDRIDAPETPEHRTMRAMLRLSNDWKVIGRTVEHLPSEYPDEHPEVREVVDSDDLSGIGKSLGVSRIYISAVRKKRNLCPCCGHSCHTISYETRYLRHIDDMGCKCYLVVNIPKYRCDHCGSTPRKNFPAASPRVSYTREFAKRGSSGLRVDCLDPCHGWSPTSVAGLVLETDPSRGFSARPEHSQTSRRRGGFSVTPLLSL